MRKLTIRQSAVLAAIERRRKCSLVELWDDFPDLPPSAVLRVIDALELRGLVNRTGNPDDSYVGGVTFAPTSRGERSELPA